MCFPEERFLERVNWGGGRHTLGCTWLHPMGCCLVLNIREKGRIWAQHQSVIFLYLLMGTVWPTASHSHHQPSQLWWTQCNSEPKQTLAPNLLFLTIQERTRLLKSILFHAKFHPDASVQWNQGALTEIWPPQWLGTQLLPFLSKILHLKFVAILPKDPPN